MTELTLESLPLFPLNSVLFPGGVLPLRVFEVRYLDMVAKCRRAQSPFGVVALAQGQEVQVAGAPAERLQPMGTLAHITAWNPAHPGLILLECTGAQRFRVDRSERLKHGLWVADVTLLPDDQSVAVPEDLRHVARWLRQVREKVQPPSVSGADHTGQAASYDDCGWVANRWCELLPLPTAMRQRLMTLQSPLLRLELVVDLLGQTGIGDNDLPQT